MEISGTVILKKGKEGSLKRFHPWIFSGAIQSLEGKVEDGNWVKVTEASGKTLGFGHYQKGTISVRVSSFGEVPPSDKFLQRKFSAAYDQRRKCGVISEGTDAFRLIHGEGDGLPGLIVDIYNGVAVVQAHSIGMHLDRHRIAEAIQDSLGEGISAVYYKSQSTLPGGKQNEYLIGMAAMPHIIHEHYCKFFVDWEEGQKTGFFLDQRENRKLLGDFSKGKTLLNTFCYTGGFSVYALHAGAALVHSVDASEKAVALTSKNIELNGFNPKEHQSFTADTFDYLKDKKDQYDVIVLDPPAFAKHKDARHQAMKGYQRLNGEAMRMIRPGGIIFTFSCSQVVERQLFYDTVVSAAIQTGREIKVLHQLSQPADHPVSLYHSEGDYLKGLVLYVAN
jgi:23S rRNA (cytosine1962-C5)-methyltransferase